MGKSSKKKIQKESRAKPLLKDKPLEAEETSVKWSLFRNPFFHLILITIIGLIAYSNTFTVPFHFDDTSNIVENYKLKDLNNYWPPTGSRWFGFLTFALNYHLGGLDTTGYHIVNLTIHILNAILIYWLVVLTLRTPYFKVRSSSFIVHSKKLMSHEPSILIALFSALLFVSHPIQTQAVTYIVQRFTSLATMFYLLSLVMYIKWRLLSGEYNPPIPPLVKGGWGGFLQSIKRYTLYPRTLSKCGAYAFSVVSAVLAMKTKEISFTLPFIIALYEFSFFSKSPTYELRTINLKKFLYLLPFLLTLLIIPLSMIGIDKPIGDVIGELRETAQETEEIPRSSYLFTQFRVIVTYIRLLFLPINQNLDYDYPIYNSFFNPEVFLSFLFLLSILGLGAYLFYRSRYNPPLPPLSKGGLGGFSDSRLSTLDFRLISFGIFWFFITLSVESSIIPIRDVIFEHRMYLPSVGTVIAFSTAVFYILYFTAHSELPGLARRSGIGKTPNYASRIFLTTAYVLLTTVVVALSIATYQRNIVWQDEVSLWEDVVIKSPNKERGYNNLGYTYATQGQIDEAIRKYQIALRLNPNYIEAYNNLGNAYHRKGWIDRAIEHHLIALKLSPNYPNAHYNIGNAYYYKGWFDKALEHFQIALRLKPDFVEAYNNIGVVYISKGWIDKAMEYYQIALRLKPNYPQAHYNLGTVYERKGLLDEAIKEYQMALRFNPKDEDAKNNLNRILQKR